MALYQWNSGHSIFRQTCSWKKKRYIPSQRTSRTKDIIYGKSTMKTGLERFPRRTVLHIFLNVGWPQGTPGKTRPTILHVIFHGSSQIFTFHVFPSFLCHSKKKWVSTPKFPTLRSFVPSPSRAIALRRPRDISPRQRGGWPLLDFIGIVMGYSLNSTYPITMVNIWLLYG